ncbi:SHOCT domain-containing protein [Wenjunlia tyrosinilytica]|jgi:hypothetical protein|uniref:Membrane protein n=1 Tax=Wenjunlia tyrosinilytica TaxID=1544741 RepID=A0A918DX57_9ACTN|nr:SHOCT domain-containing protein [Wenjunlia tyrosinilytica]GGO86051.1 membrane protein [Wenjunlia tyrosinilytica]
MDGYELLADDFPLLNAFWTMLWFFLLVLWLFLLFRVVGDVFRDDSLGGWGKAAWILFIIVLPYLGVLVYLIARGRGLGERELSSALAQRDARDAYLRQSASASSGSHADELAKLSDLKNRGELTQGEYEQAKAKILAA